MRYQILTLLLLFLILSVPSKGQDRIAYVDGPDRDKVGHIVSFEGIKKIDIELDGGIILVEATLNNTVQTFVLDSGAPGLVLNNYFHKKGKKEQMTGISGTAEAFAVMVEDFVWAGITYPKMEAISMDLSHLESMTKRKISGLIGYELIKDFEIFLDYEGKAIQIKSVGNYSKEKHHPLVSFPLSFENHLPVIKAKIGKENLRLGLDTGAEINVLDKRLSSQIAEMTSEPQVYRKIYGVGNNDEPAQLIKVSVTKLERATYREMNYVLTDFSSILSGGTNIDGILGFPFLSSCKFSIDFKTQQLNVWP